MAATHRITLEDLSAGGKAYERDLVLTASTLSLLKIIGEALAEDAEGDVLGANGTTALVAIGNLMAHRNLEDETLAPALEALFNALDTGTPTPGDTATAIDTLLNPP